MQEKEKKLCALIHHTATVIGFILGVKALCPDRPGAMRKGLLAIFLASQTWALAKIARSAVTGKQCLQQSFDNIQELSKNRQAQRTATWLLVAVSGWFKIGTPVLLRN